MSNYSVENIPRGVLGKLESVEKSFPQSARPTENQREIMRMHDFCAWQSV